MNTSNPLTAANTILAKAKEEINALLTADDHGMIRLSFNSGIDSLINRFSFLTNHTVAPVTKDDFPPVTNFMGEELSPVKEITKADLNPEQEQKQIFINKVEKLEAEFDTIAPEGILNSYTLPEDVMVVRGVAKRAGVEDYDTRELNIPFIEAISKALKEKAAGDAEQKRIDAELDKDVVDDKFITEEELDELVDDLDEEKAAGDAEQNSKPLYHWNKTELQTELTRLSIAFETDANKKALVELIEKARQ